MPPWRRLIPATLFGQTVLILLAGLVFSTLIGILTLTFNQAAVVRAMGAFAATQRIANLARLVDEAPADWRSRLIAAASDQTLQITLPAGSPAWAKAPAAGAGARTVRKFLAAQLPPSLGDTLRVEVGSVRFETTLAARRGMMGMMGGGAVPSLKKLEPDQRVAKISHCRDTYRVTTEDGKTRAFWERNLRLMTDASDRGPEKDAPVIVAAGMMGDRADVIFASPEEISGFIASAC